MSDDTDSLAEFAPIRAIEWKQYLSDWGPYRLGRHQLHDPRSFAFDAKKLTTPRELVDTSHRCHAPAWNQRDIGSCTAHAALGLMMTEPFYRGRMFVESDCEAFYAKETELDNSEIPASYPPVDTGSTGLWSMKVLKNEGLIAGYYHAFRVSTVLHLLLDYPVSIGIPWYRSMFYTNQHDTIHVDECTGVVGGHQVAVTALDAGRSRVLIRNSWGPEWGWDGSAWLSIEDLDRLLNEGGDAVVPVMPV